MTSKSLAAPRGWDVRAPRWEGGAAPTRYHNRQNPTGLRSLRNPDGPRGTHCDTVEETPPLSGAAVAICPTCTCRLERTNGRSLCAALACACTTLVLLVPANRLPLMRVSRLGMTRQSRLASGV